MVAQPKLVYLDQPKRLICGPCRPTDGYSSILHAYGMKARMGDFSTPSTPVLDRHIRWMMKDADRLYRSARNPAQRRVAARYGFATLTFWLGWLCSMEGFSLRWCDVDVTAPPDGPSMDLP
jgi:hypothetical protein